MVSNLVHKIRNTVAGFGGGLCAALVPVCDIKLPGPSGLPPAPTVTDTPILPEYLKPEPPPTIEECEQVWAEYQEFNESLNDMNKLENFMDEFTTQYQNSPIDAFAYAAFVWAGHQSGVIPAATPVTNAVEWVGEILETASLGCSRMVDEENVNDNYNWDDDNFDGDDTIYCPSDDVIPGTISLQNTSGDHIRIYIFVNTNPEYYDNYTGSIDLYGHSHFCRVGLELEPGFTPRDDWTFVVTDPERDDDDSIFYGDYVLKERTCSSRSSALRVLWNGHSVECRDY